MDSTKREPTLSNFLIFAKNAYTKERDQNIYMYVSLIV